MTDILLWSTDGGEVAVQKIQEAANYKKLCGTEENNQYCLIRSNYSPKYVLLLYTDHADVVQGTITQAGKQPVGSVPPELWRENLSLRNETQNCFFSSIPSLPFRFKNNRLYDAYAEIVIVSIQINTTGTYPLLYTDTIDFIGIRLDTTTLKKTPVVAVYQMDQMEASALTACLTSIGYQFVLS
jgi:hypothetical protein